MFHKKKLVLIISTISIIAVLCGCTSNNEKSSYKYTEIGNGFYVFDDKDGKFYPLVESDMSKLSNDPRKTDLLFWFKQEYEDEIPVVKEGTQLILNSSDSIPDGIILQEAIDYGCTLGCILVPTNSEAFALSKDSTHIVCDGSSFKEWLSDTSGKSLDDIRLLTVGGTKLSNNQLTEINTVKDLEFNKEYKIDYSKGTKVSSAKIIADTRAFMIKSDSTYGISENNFHYTDDGYITIEFPPGIPAGYFYLKGSETLGLSGGLFKYEPLNIPEIPESVKDKPESEIDNIKN